ncbi:hypothetical protein DL768_008408 [Monosporascus sp. mg162]|nr:hypothetical protein DL768_008408 [Monosporascus sp. mg162]
MSRTPHSSRGRGGSGDVGAPSHRSTAENWWKIYLFRGMVNDVRRRAPYYWSDWRDAWDYRVVPATIYMYFAKYGSPVGFSGAAPESQLGAFRVAGSAGLCRSATFPTRSCDTDMQYGVNEVLLSSVLGAVVFAILACQPLVIVGVTGPITVFNYTVYDIMMPTGTNYLAFMCWIGLWSLVFHWILAITNSCNWLKYVTRFPCDIFGFYVAFIYLQKGIQVLEILGDGSPFYLSIMIALLVFMVAYVCGELGESPLFRHPVRIFLKDYGTPLTVIFFTGERGWFIRFWDIPVGDIFIAIPFAVLLTILFYFDHNVSSLIAQGTEFPLRKPAGFHWDIFLLGLTTGVAGLLGLPFPNGLIPQAPFHTESLCVTKAEVDTDESGESKGHYTFKATHVVEQRVSNLAQGLLTLGTMSGPLLVVLDLIPQAVLAGLFFIMGYQALKANGITAKILFLCRDEALTPPGHPLLRIRRRGALWAFVAVELLGFGATFAITQTVAAVGFPVFILALIPIRALLLPRWFTPQELAALDAPTASPFTMESAGGSYGGSADDNVDALNPNRAAAGSGSDTDDPAANTSGCENTEGKSQEDLAELGEGGARRARSLEVEQAGVSRRGHSDRGKGDPEKQ